MGGKKGNKRCKKQWQNTVTINVEDETCVLTERDQNILGKKSPYFRKIFSTTDQACPDIKSREITLKDVSAKSFRKIIRFFRYRHLKLRVSNIVEISIIADKFLYEDLVHFCKRYVDEKVNSKNILQMWSLPVREIEPYHPNIIEEKVKEVMRYDNWRQISVEDVDFRVIYMYLTDAKCGDYFEKRGATLVLNWFKQNIQSNDPCYTDIQEQCEYLLENAVDWSNLSVVDVAGLCYKYRAVFDGHLQNFARHLEVYKSILETYGPRFEMGCFRELKPHIDSSKERECNIEMFEFYESSLETITKMSKFTRKNVFP